MTAKTCGHTHSGLGSLIGHAMAYDAVRAVTVLFGGYNFISTHESGTSEWNGTVWTGRTVIPNPHPSGRFEHAMAYDAARGVTVLFGGSSQLNDGITGTSDTWEWNGTAWTQQLVSGPSPRRDHAMAYDAARGVTILFGGNRSNFPSNGETWELNIPCIAPSITAQPAAQTVSLGNTASFTVVTTGTGPLTHQWRRNRVPMSPSANIPNVTSATLTISPVTLADDAFYDCMIANPCGTVVTALVSLTVCPGSGPGFDCNTNGLCDALELTGLRDITAPTPATGDRFGWNVALDGSRLLVGARAADTVAGVDAGAAYVYTGTGGAWTPEATLLPPDGEPGADFGSQVALQGQWAMAAARFASVGGQAQAGAVYVYRNTGSGWNYFQKLTEPTPTAGAWFGHGVSIDGDRAAIGSILGTGTQPQSGVAYVYRFNGVNWAREATLIAPDGVSGDGFGVSVAIDDPYMVVGAPYVLHNGVRSGAAYVYFRSVNGWVFQSKLLPPTAESNETFGELVGISGDIVAVNAPRETVSGVTRAGAAHTYRRTDTRWTHQRRVVAATPQANELFSYYLALDGDTLAAGGFLRQVAGVAGAGSVDVFRRRGNFWTRADHIDSPKPELDARFGYALAVSGSRMAAGAHGGSARLVPAAGWVRVFDLAVLDCDNNGVPDQCQVASGASIDADGNGIPDNCQLTACRADFNDSGTLSVQDIFDFLADFFAGNLTADFNDSGLLSVQDIFDFLAAYFAGCA